MRFLFIFFLFISTQSHASEILIDGDIGARYSIECLDTKNIRTSFTGVAPKKHNFKSQYPIMSCQVKKDATARTLVVQFILEPAGGFGLDPNQQMEFSLKKKNERIKVDFTYTHADRLPDAISDQSQPFEGLVNGEAYTSGPSGGWYNPGK
jgi:hypothetical protein